MNREKARQLLLGLSSLMLFCPEKISCYWQGKTRDKLLRLLDRHPDLLEGFRVKVAA